MVFAVNSIKIKNACTITTVFVNYFFFFYLFGERALDAYQPKNNLTSTVFASALGVYNIIISLVKRYITDTKTIRCTQRTQLDDLLNRWHVQ